MEPANGLGGDNDPGTWSVDQVIQEFSRDSTSTWLTPELTKLVQAIPHRNDLEQKLRDNDVDGDTLLALDMASIRDDLGISSLGQRRAIMRAIDYLRLQSESYQNTALQASAIARLQSPLYSTPQLSHLDFPVPPQSPAASALDRIRSRAGLPTHSPSSSIGLGMNYFTFPHQQQQPPFPKPEVPSPDTRQAACELTPAVAQTLEKIDSSAAEPAAIDNPSIFSKATINGHSDPLDLLQASVEAQSSQNHQANQKTDISTVENDDHVRQAKPKKRAVLTLVKQAEEIHSNPDDSYLSKESKPIQDTFYFRLSTGWDPELYRLPEDDALEGFCFMNRNDPPGRKQVVAKQMKYFLRQKPLISPQNGSLLKIPYGPKRCQKPSKQFFTLFPHNSNRPVVCAASDFPQLLKDAVLPNSMRYPPISFSELPDTPVDILSHHATDTQAQSSTADLGEFESLLSKYPVAVADQGLPVYGDSGDEEEFDLETWNEIEEERAERQFSSSAMSASEVESTINETLEAYRADWSETKLPKLRLKAYLLWMRSAKQKTRKAALENAQLWRDRSTQQLQKMKEAILKDVWHKSSDVKHQCQSMELTVYSIEENLYLIQTLLSDQQPERPNKAECQRKVVTRKPVLEEGEELLDSDSVANDDDLNEFLDDSSDARSIHHEPDDDEDEWNPVILKDEKTTPAAKVKATPEPIRPEENPEPTAEIHDHDADVETDTDDAVATPRARRRMLAEKQESARKLNLKEPFTPKKKFIAPPNPDRSTPVKISDSDSDYIDRPEVIPSRYLSSGMSRSLAIDLTKSSPPPDEKHGDNSSSEMDVRTPDLNPQPDSPKVCRRSSIMTENLRGVSLSDSTIPGAEDFHGIRATDWALIEDNSDSRRALAKAVYHLHSNAIQKLVDLTSDASERKSKGRELLMNAFLAYKEDKENAERRLRHLVLLYIVYHSGQNFLGRVGPSKDQMDQAFEKIHGTAQRFFDLLSGFLDVAMFASKSKQQGISQTHKKRKWDSSFSDISTLDDMDRLKSDDPNSDVVELPQQLSSIKKRKRAVAESQEANLRQQSDQQRIEEQDRRRKIMEQRYAQFGAGHGDTLSPVNFTEPIVYLDPYIASRVKPHQLKGIQFMWREIIEDPKQQGCILAHTMGLGKTMQVISLLVTIAQCARSKDHRIRHHIPSKARKGKTLIICPASLVDNWFDELLMWSPDRHILGEIHKVDSPDAQVPRLWAQNGGILIISYSRFVRMINAAHDPTKINPYESSPSLEKILLEEPTLVIADEAHQMKNPKSAINQAASRFKTLSRIALTGSPLNNHLEEYHTMVDWIAPGYLGSMVQFKAKYSEPISEGLYAESTPLERRTALRKLHVLKRDLDPKINRADISAIEKDMTTKTEYFITIPLTDLQKEAYNTYVQYMKQTFSTRGRGAQAKLWAWVAMLQILCNHPKCCYDKLCARQSKLLEKPAANGDEPVTENEVQSEKENPDVESPFPDDVAIDTQGPMLEAMQKVLEVFNRATDTDRLTNHNLSYRTWLVHDIVAEAVKIRDKTLIFSHSIPTLNYLEQMLSTMNCRYIRLDGETKIGERQNMTKNFNKTNRYDVFLISMKAGGLGMNLQGANRVIIFDFMYNPSWEEQAIGRAYRLGQTKPVYVYRFRAGGTFEEVMFNKAMFKKQVFSRVVDHKNPVRHALKNIAEWLFPVQETEQKEFDEHIGKDQQVLDKIIKRVSYIRNIELTETFQREDNEKLDDEEVKIAEAEFQNERLLRENPEAFFAKLRDKEHARRSAPNPRAMGYPATPFQSPHFQNHPRSSHVNGYPAPTSNQASDTPNSGYSSTLDLRGQVHIPQQHFPQEIAFSNGIRASGSTTDGAIEHLKHPRDGHTHPRLF